MAWQLQGSFFESCPCDTVCPCVTSAFTAPADVDRCLMVLVWHIESGEVEDVDVSGLNVAIFGDTPPVMADGNWRIGMIMDAAASPAQADKLGAVFGGQLGGPMEEFFAPMIGERLGVEVAPIEYRDEGRRHEVRIGEFAEVGVEDFVPPQAPDREVYQLTHVFHPVNETLNIGTTTRSRFKAFGYEFSHEGKFADSTSFAWSA